MMRFSPSRPRRAFHQPPGRENARGFTEFATVKAILANRTDKAVLLAREDLVAPVWVPRHALEATSRIKVDDLPLKAEVEVRVELNLALERKLV